jgi:threonine/homoserine/homoserine lactone efflux protein
MPLALIAVAAIAAGITLVLADDRVGRISPRGPETGAVQARVMGLILLVAGGLTFLSWAY